MTLIIDISHTETITTSFEHHQFVISFFFKKNQTDLINILTKVLRKKSRDNRKIILFLLREVICISVLCLFFFKYI